MRSWAVRHLVIGADSATAAILYAGLVGMKVVPKSPEFWPLPGSLPLSRADSWFGRIARLGFLANFLSRSVLVGFLTGVGIQVAARQVAGMLAVPDAATIRFGSGTIEKLLSALSHLPQASIPSIVCSACVMAVILGARKINKKIPGPLIAVVGAIVVSFIVGPISGLELVGTVPRGIPHVGLPSYDGRFWVDNVSKVLPICVSLFVVMIAQSAATSRAYAARYDEPLKEGSDILALGVANISAGLTGTFPVNGSPTKTQMVDTAGARTQLAQLTMAFIVIIVLVFLTGPLAKMPLAVLDSVVFLIGIQLVDVEGLRNVWQARRVEFWVALVTAVVVVLIGVEQAILLAIVLSLLEYVRHGYKTRNAVLQLQNSNALVPMPVSSHAEALPGLVIYRFNTAVYFANADFFAEEALSIIKQAGPPPVRWFCFAGDAVYNVDYTAGVVLVQVCKAMQSRGVKVTFANIEDPVLTELTRSGVTALVGEDAFFATAHDVLVAYRQSSDAQAVEHPEITRT